MLYGKTLEEIGRNGAKYVVGCVALEPWKNDVSVRMIEKRGWEMIDKIEKNDGLIFGIYCKSIK